MVTPSPQLRHLATVLFIMPNTAICWVCVHISFVHFSRFFVRSQEVVPSSECMTCGAMDLEEESAPSEDDLYMVGFCCRGLQLL
jgi:hypothetical protein